MSDFKDDGQPKSETLEALMIEARAKFLASVVGAGLSGLLVAQMLISSIETPIHIGEKFAIQALFVAWLGALGALAAHKHGERWKEAERAIYRKRYVNAFMEHDKS